MKFIKRFLFKRWLARLIEKQAWESELNADYDESLIPDLEKLVQLKKSELEKAEAELSSGNLDGHKREDREKIKEISERVKRLKREIELAENTIAEVKKAVASKRQEGARLKHKANFIKRA